MRRLHRLVRRRQQDFLRLARKGVLANLLLLLRRPHRAGNGVAADGLQKGHLCVVSLEAVGNSNVRQMRAVRVVAERRRHVPPIANRGTFEVVPEARVKHRVARNLAQIIRAEAPHTGGHRVLFDERLLRLVENERVVGR